MRSQSLLPLSLQTDLPRIRRALVWGVLGVLLAFSGDLFPCEECAEKGVRFEKVQVKHTRPDGTTVEHTSEKSLFCSCAAGKNLAREACLILGAVIQDLETRISESEKGIRGWKVRLESARKLEQPMQQDLYALQTARTDVRDQVQKTQARLDQLRVELKTCEESRSKLDLNLAMGKRRLERSMLLLESVKQRLGEAGEKLPAPERRPLPLLELFTVADLGKAVSPARAVKAEEADPATATQTSAPGRKKMKTYVLTDGRKIRAKLTLDQGEELLIKGEDGQMTTVKKNAIDHFIEE